MCGLRQGDYVHVSLRLPQHFMINKHVNMEITQKHTSHANTHTNMTHLHVSLDLHEQSHTHTHFNCDYRQTMTVNGRLHQSQFLVCWQSGDYLSRDTGSTVEPQMVAHLWASKNSQPVGTSRVCQTFSKFPPFVLNISKMHFSVLTEQPNFGIKKNDTNERLKYRFSLSTCSKWKHVLTS